MSDVEKLRELIEAEERRTVGNAFGGKGKTGVFSVPNVAAAIAELQLPGTVGRLLSHLRRELSAREFLYVLRGTVRFAFLIELTNLKVGSTKMKTRWLPGLILMPQPGSFAPIQGRFEPGNDARAATFADCMRVLERSLELTVDQLVVPRSRAILDGLMLARRVPYEFPIGYLSTQTDTLHRADNVMWLDSADLSWLVKARPLLTLATGQAGEALAAIEEQKLEVKVFKTDRSLTGKDKTNRAKRWEVLPGDFQHATLLNCWSAERKLTEGLACFEDFPRKIRSEFEAKGLLSPDSPPTRCPITLEPMSFPALAKAVLGKQHGRSDYQIGHLVPLKNGGRHDGSNVCWQSADGNRIQGDLTVPEIIILLEKIEARRRAILEA